MPYSKMLKESMASNVILEINQQNAIGFTSRLLESIMYNKKLITNNETVLKTKYYNPKFIRVFKNVDDLDCPFIKEQEIVDYKYSGDFSPMVLISQIERVLENGDK